MEKKKKTRVNKLNGEQRGKKEKQTYKQNTKKKKKSRNTNLEKAIIEIIYYAILLSMDHGS